MSNEAKDSPFLMKESFYYPDGSGEGIHFSEKEHKRKMYLNIGCKHTKSERLQGNRQDCCVRRLTIKKEGAIIKVPKKPNNHAVGPHLS